MLTHLKVKNYRSLKDMELSLGPLVVLIGPNGSGKSNILDLLRIVQQLFTPRSRTDEVLAVRGGYKEVVWGGRVNEEIIFELGWRSTTTSKGDHSKYMARIGRDEYNIEGFNTERIEGAEEDSLSRDSREFTYKGRPYSVDRRACAISVLKDLGLESPKSTVSVRDWAFYRFNPSLMRAPQSVRKEYRLLESGQNLSTVIHTLYSEGNPALGEIVDVLRACVPTVEDLHSPIHGEGQTYIALKEESVPEAVGSWGLSDGTLLALALATALLTPQPPSLLALEAPDIELHPHVMETLAEMLLLASRRTQVIATTHSPYLLDYLPPKSFVVVDKINGATRCKTLRGRKGVQRVMEELGAGKAWYSGHIGGVP